MQKISSVLKVALTVQRRTCVTGDDEYRGRSSIRSTVEAKITNEDLINDRQATDGTEFIIRAGNIKEHCTQDI